MRTPQAGHFKGPSWICPIQGSPFATMPFAWLRDLQLALTPKRAFKPGFFKGMHSQRQQGQATRGDWLDVLVLLYNQQNSVGVVCVCMRAFCCLFYLSSFREGMSSKNIIERGPLGRQRLSKGMGCGVL